MRLRSLYALRAPEGAESSNPAGVTPTATATPPAPATPPATPPSPPPPAAAASSAPAADPPPQKKGGADVELSAEAFKDRIAQAKKNGGEAAVKDLFKTLGVANETELKAKIDAANAAEEAKKSDLQRATEKAEKLKPAAEKAASLEQRVTAYAAREMGKLTESQQAAVKRIAGDDPAKQLDTIEALSSTWGAPAPAGTEKPATTEVATPPAGQPAAKPVAPPPASTSNAGGPPRPASPGAPDHKAVYAELQKSNPMKAAAYGLRHEAAIFGDGSSGQ